MTKPDLSLLSDEQRTLWEAEARMTPEPWVLWDGCSWRRFGSEATQRTVIEPTNHPIDRHPDLSVKEEDAKGLCLARNQARANLEEIIRLRELTQLQDQLLACYRLGKHPSDSLLDRIRIAREEIDQRRAGVGQ